MAKGPQIPGTILDRLIDHDPDLLRDAPRSTSAQISNLKASIRRDLEFLLNARRPALAWPTRMKHLNRSVLAYGVPDVSDNRADVVTSRENLRIAMETAIRTFEPRLSNVRVAVVKNDALQDRVLRFRIEAVINRVIGEPVSFDSVLEPASGVLSVDRARR